VEGGVIIELCDFATQFFESV